MTDTTPDDLPGDLPTPPWGPDFSPERAWEAITSLRAREKALSKTQVTPDQLDALAQWQAIIDAGVTPQARVDQQIDRLSTRIGQAEVRVYAAAAGLDPDAALAAVDAASYVDQAGDFDTESLRVDLAGLVAARTPPPQRPAVRAPAPNRSQGAAEIGPDVDGRLEAARRHGDWRTILAIENGKLRGRP